MKILSRFGIAAALSLALASAAGAATVHLIGGKSVEGEILSITEKVVRVKTAQGEVPIPVEKIARPDADTLKKADKAGGEGNYKEARRLSEIVIFWDPTNAEAQRIRTQAMEKLAAKDAKAVEKLAAKDAKAGMVPHEKEAAEATQTLRSAASAMGKNPPSDPEVFQKDLIELRDATKEAADLYKDTAQASPLTALLGSMDENLTKVAAAVERKKAAAGTPKTDMSTTAPKPAAEPAREKILAINAPGAKVDIEKFTVPGFETIVFFHMEDVAACRPLGMRLEELAKGHPRVYLRAVDIGGWKSPVAMQYKIDTVPSVWVFDQKGKLIAKGLNNPDAIVEALFKSTGQTYKKPQ